MKWIKRYLEKQKQKRIERREYKEQQNIIARRILNKIIENFDWRLLTYSDDRQFTYKDIVVDEYCSQYDDIWYVMSANGAEIECDDNISKSLYHYFKKQHSGNKKERIHDAIETL